MPVPHSSATGRPIPTIRATMPCLSPPAWATGQRALFTLLDQGWRRFAQLYTRPDGSLRYDGVLSTRDGGDDFLEPFFNWPQLYLLGGADDLLATSAHHWQGVVGQLTALGIFRDEFEIGYDWFHQGEALLLFYFLTMADPVRWATRAQRFADLYVEPAHGNYDPVHNLVRAPHNGSGGAREALTDSTHYPWTDAEATQYGYPLSWLAPAGTAPPTGEDPRLGIEMQRRIGRGDSVGNLGIAGLVLNAYLATGRERYAQWLDTYVTGWLERARANHGLVPDNVGIDGVVGSQLDGRWYGSHYGWSWPHGLYSIGQAVTVGAIAAALANRDDRYLELPRTMLDTIQAQARVLAVTDSDSSVRPRWLAHLGPAAQQPLQLVPNRYDDDGWFDYNPIQASVPMALWFHSGDASDRARLDALRADSGYPWETVRPFRDKEEAGHEEPWYAYLRGDNPEYPTAILDAAQAQARRRLALMEQYADHPVTEPEIHLFQDVNPVVTEALCQLTWGGPQVVYNGGPAQARLRHYDAAARRPGLPDEVAALVSCIDPDATTLTLVNLSGVHARELIIQGGAFAEHEIVSASYVSAAPGWAGTHQEYIAHEPRTERVQLPIGGPWLSVTLPPGTQLELALKLELGVYRPSFRTPWIDPTHPQPGETA